MIKEHKATMHREALSKPVYFRLMLPIAIVIVALVGIFAAVFYSIYQNNLHESNQDKMVMVSAELEEKLDEQSLMLSAILEALLNDPNLANALKFSDRQRLLDDYEEIFASLRAEHSITHFYFHNPDRVNLLRMHSPQKHDDIINRFTALAAESTGATASGIELGPMGTFTLRVVKPVFEEDILIGYVELGKEIEDILVDMGKEHEIELAAVINKDLLDRENWEEGMKLLGRESNWNRFPNKALIYSSQPQYPVKLDSLINEGNYTHYDEGNQTKFDGSTWWITVIPLEDASGMEVGDLILMNDISDKVTTFNQIIIGVMCGIVLLVILLFGSLHFLLRRTDKVILFQQTELSKNTEKYRFLTENIDGLVAMSDMEGNYIYANEAHQRLLGYSIDEMVGRSSIEFIHPDDQEIVTQMLLLNMNKGTNVFQNLLHFRMKSKDGCYRWIEVNGRFIQGEDGSPKAMIVVGTDFTARKQMEDALRESEEKMKRIFETVGDGIVVSSLDGQIVSLNESVVHMHGYESIAELMGRNSGELLASDDREWVINQVMNSVQEATPSINLQCGFLKADGTEFPGEFSSVPLRDQSGNIEGWVTISRDITERKRAENELHQSTEKIQTILSSMYDGVATLDTFGTITDSNDALAILHGYKQKEDIVGFHAINLIAEVDKNRVVQDIEKLLSDKEVPLSEYMLYRKGSDDFPAEVATSQLKDGDGSISGVVAVMRDITERKQTENKLAQKMQELKKNEMATLNIMEDLQKNLADMKQTKEQLSAKNEELITAEEEQRELTRSLEEQNMIVIESQKELSEALERAVMSEEEIKDINQHLEERVGERTLEITKLLEQKQAFISQLAHDLRTPLTPMVALLPMLRDRQVEEQTRHMADMAVRNVEFMEELVNKTVQLAKLNSLDVNFEANPVKIDGIIKSVLERNQFRLAQNSITFENVMKEDIVVTGDRLRIIEVYENLISNAIKFTNKGGILTFDARRGDGFAVLSLKDTGIGISPEQADHIFDEFYKADQSRHELGSAGLGLSICSRIIEKHGGHIWAESEGEGQGTTFLFTLPLMTKANEFVEKVANTIKGSGIMDREN